MAERRSHLILVGLILAALVGVALLVIPGSPGHKKPTLGLDLQGGLEVVLRAQPPRGTTKLPAGAAPSRCTSLLVRVRPFTLPLRPVPSINSSTPRPTNSEFRSSEISSWSSTSRSNRSCTTSFGTCS